MPANLMQFLALVLGFGLWAALGFFGKVPLDPLIALLQMGLGGLITHMLKDVGASAVSGAQAGFARLRLLSIVAAVCVGLSLAGCTTTTASMYTGLYTQAKAGVQVFDDNSLTTMRDLLCAQPYAAIQRHPEAQPGIVALCGPLAGGSALDAGQLAMLMSLLQQSGVKLQAAPAAAASGVR